MPHLNVIFNSSMQKVESTKYHLYLTDVPAIWICWRFVQSSRPAVSIQSTTAAEGKGATAMP
jgi:hypothetical protein